MALALRSGHQEQEPGGIDVMRFDRTLGQSRHVACRIKLYVDENFP
jgi:hypothetical protein